MSEMQTPEFTREMLEQELVGLDTTVIMTKINGMFIWHNGDREQQSERDLARERDEPIERVHRGIQRTIDRGEFLEVDYETYMRWFLDDL